MAMVEAYTASWIEITHQYRLWQFLCVEAYTASWIEISRAIEACMKRRSRLIRPRGLKCSLQPLEPRPGMSRLIRPRGLKCLVQLQPLQKQRRGLYGLVD